MRYFILLALVIGSYSLQGQYSHIYLPVENEVIFKAGIKEMYTWRVNRTTGKRVLESVVKADAATMYLQETSYLDFFDKPTLRIKEEKWNADHTVFTYSDMEKDSTGKEILIEKRTEYYNANKNIVKRVTESMSGHYNHFTQYIHENNPSYQNNVWIKIRPAADTFQFIVNSQNDTLHHYFIKEKINGNWIITEEAFTRYKNGEFYAYENYRNGQLLNKHTAEEKKRNDSTVVDDDPLQWMMDHPLPPHQHPEPTDTTYSTERDFKNKRLIKNKRTGQQQYKRIRTFMNEDKKYRIEEYIYDWRGLLLKRDLEVEDYVVEFTYK